jgi:hypothetical protein
LIFASFIIFCCNKYFFLFFKVMVKERKRLVPLIESESGWQHLICRLSVLVLAYLNDSGENPASCLRFLEVFAGGTTYSPHRSEAVLGRLYRHLVAREYFAVVRRLIGTRIPPLLEPMLRAPTPLAGEILQMVCRPVHIAAQTQVKIISSGPYCPDTFQTYEKKL